MLQPRAQFDCLILTRNSQPQDSRSTCSVVVVFLRFSLEDVGRRWKMSLEDVDTSHAFPWKTLISDWSFEDMNPIINSRLPRKSVRRANVFQGHLPTSSNVFQGKPEESRGALFGASPVRRDTEFCPVRSRGAPWRGMVVGVGVLSGGNVSSRRRHLVSWKLLGRHGGGSGCDF